LFRHEKKAMATLKMTLTKELLHQVKKFPTAKEMFDAVEKRYVGNEEIKKNKGKLLKKEMSVFKYMQNESLDDIINRFYHLISELESYDLIHTYTST